MDNTSNNKRIAKNTLLLYFRMLFIMVVNLYTSRVVLNTLGVEDYGVYNVVGGVVVMFSFISSSLGGASSRFITYDLGKGDVNRLEKTFGNVLSIHILLALVMLVLAETIGLWFVMNKLQVPENRVAATHWVYQFSVLSFLANVISVPYSASVIAHERMKAFACISVADAVLKLLVVYLLVLTLYDKLIVYGALLFCVCLFDRVAYGVYCNIHFEETKARISIDKKQFKEMLSFAVWTMNGNLAVVGYTQGINILLNMFFGPVVNAARGIAVQVQGVVHNFCYNFQMALNPQLTKGYAQQDFFHMHQLLKLSSKFSFFLLLIICLPLILEAPLVLKWWLGIVPEHTVNFLRLILCSTMLIAMSNPLVVSIHATGKIKRFQAIEGTLLLSIVPIAYILLKFFSISPEQVFCVHIVVEMITQYARVRIVLPQISMTVKDYYVNVVIPIMKVSIIATIIPFICYLRMIPSLRTFFIVCIVSALSSLFAIYIFGCTKKERFFVKDRIRIIFLRLQR